MTRPHVCSQIMERAEHEKHIGQALTKKQVVVVIDLMYNSM